MNIIYFLLPISLALGLGFLCLFIWAMRNGQFEDLQMPAFRILYDEDNSTHPTKSDSGQ